MAGKYTTVLNPGYSTLWVKDLPYLAGSGDASGVNPFKPNDARPLVEGEWLERAASGSNIGFTRGGNNAMSSPGTPDGEGTKPAFLYYLEEGRIDAQVAGLAHCIMGPLGFEIRTKLCYSSGLNVNDKVSVWDFDGRSSSYGIVRRVLAAFSSGWVVGRVSRIYGQDDIAVIVGLQ